MNEKIRSNNKDLEKVRSIAWDFAQEWNRKADNEWKDDPVFAQEMKITQQQVNESIILIDEEIRISGEENNNFSRFYVNYYSDYGTSLMDYLQNHGCWSEWYCPGYMIAGVD